MAARLRLFGRPAIEHAGATIELPAERRCQLLAVLALRHSWVTRAELAALLWPQQAQALALTNVRKALHAARAWPWTSALEAQGSAVRFEVETDVAAFERALHGSAWWCGSTTSPRCTRRALNGRRRWPTCAKACSSASTMGWRSCGRT